MLQNVRNKKCSLLLLAAAMKPYIGFNAEPLVVVLLLHPFHIGDVDFGRHLCWGVRVKQSVVGTNKVNRNVNLIFHEKLQKN